MSQNGKPEAKTENISVSRELYLDAFRWILLARTFEDKMSALYRAGKVVGGVYVGNGHEAFSVSLGMQLDREKGAAHATSFMADKLSGNSKVRMINSAQMSHAVNEVSGGFSGTIAALGEKVNCEGVLITTIRRYVQRDGTELAVDTPASADFEMVLRHAPTGAMLWSADFQETQEPLLSNIFSFNKMQKRGFHWVTAEELLEQGLQQRLDECPYLK